MANSPLRILFVCTGNICRSPTAEVVFRKLAQERGVADRFDCDSAGTQAYHAGHGADPRSVEHGQRRGLDFSSHRARKLVLRDFEEFDWVLAMDRTHLEAMHSMAYDGQKAKIGLFLSAVPENTEPDMPDPYYGGVSGFEQVLDLCEAAGKAWLDRLTSDSRS